MNKPRLLQLALFLDSLEPEQFDFTIIRTTRSCGTVACGIGWCPNAFPDYFTTAPGPTKGDKNRVLVQLKNGEASNMLAAELFFELSYSQTLQMFTPGYALPHTATAKDLAAYIREFVG